MFISHKLFFWHPIVGVLEKGCSAEKLKFHYGGSFGVAKIGHVLFSSLFSFFLSSKFHRVLFLLLNISLMFYWGRVRNIKQFIGLIGILCARIESMAGRQWWLG
jgi:hypothetical protein